jgi:hypothetical protein
VGAVHAADVVGGGLGIEADGGDRERKWEVGSGEEKRSPDSEVGSQGQEAEVVVGFGGGHGGCWQDVERAEGWRGVIGETGIHGEQKDAKDAKIFGCFALRSWRCCFGRWATFRIWSWGGKAMSAEA